MPTIFEPLSTHVSQVFEQRSQVTTDLKDTLGDPDRIRAILSGYSHEDLQRLVVGEVANMDQRSKRKMMERAGSVSNFLKAVMTRVAVRLVADKVIKLKFPVFYTQSPIR